MMKASGTFSNVATKSEPYEAPTEGPALVRVVHDRRFEGHVSGTSRAELQTCVTGDGRFGYVGTDRFSGRVGERAGTFVFQHGGTRDEGKLRPFGFIVPGSGTGALAGIRGVATIVVTDAGEHRLELEYELA